MGPAIQRNFISQVVRLRLALVLASFLNLGWYAGPALGNEQIIITGQVWYDDNGNRVLDPGEELAPGAAIFVLTRNTRGQPSAQGRWLSDSSGSFTIALIALDPPAALGATALRPRYPYHPAVGENYRGGIDVPLSSRGAERVRVDIPLFPLPGVLERLAPGSPSNFPLPDGHFFSQTNGYIGGSALGFSVTNAEGIPFWETWQRLGLENVGYPLSDRFQWGPFPTQVFQKAVFQWQPGKGLFFVNVFDELHERGFDPALRAHRSTPFPLLPAFDAGKPWDQIVADRLALLDANPAIKARYFAVPDPLLQYGLPTSRVEDFGNVLVIRTQRTVFQQWTVDVRWAGAGEVTIANGGEISKEFAIFPRDFIVGGGTKDPFQTELPPGWSGG